MLPQVEEHWKETGRVERSLVPESSVMSGVVLHKVEDVWDGGVLRDGEHPHRATWHIIIVCGGKALRRER